MGTWERGNVGTWERGNSWAWITGRCIENEASWPIVPARRTLWSRIGMLTRKGGVVLYHGG